MTDSERPHNTTNPTNQRAQCTHTRIRITRAQRTYTQKFESHTIVTGGKRQSRQTLMTKGVTAVKQSRNFVTLNGEDVLADATLDIRRRRSRLQAEVCQRQLIPGSARHSASIFESTPLKYILFFI